MTPDSKHRIPGNTNPRHTLQEPKEQYGQSGLEYDEPAHGPVEGPELVQPEGEFRG